MKSHEIAIGNSYHDAFLKSLYYERESDKFVCILFL